MHRIHFTERNKQRLKTVMLNIPVLLGQKKWFVEIYVKKYLSKFKV